MKQFYNFKNSHNNTGFGL